MLRLLGNIDNAKRLIQLELDFPAKVQQIRVAWMAFDRKISRGGKHAAEGKKAKTAQLFSWSGQWKRKYDTVYAYSQLAALTGRQWGLAWRIIIGQYPSA